MKFRLFILTIVLIAASMASAFAQDTRKIVDSFKTNMVGKYSGGVVTDSVVANTSFIFYNSTATRHGKCIFNVADGTTATFEIDSLFAAGLAESGNTILVAYAGTFYIGGAHIKGFHITEWTNDKEPQLRIAVYLFIGKQKFKFYNVNR